jgi:hypothetical protein
VTTADNSWLKAVAERDQDLLKATAKEERGDIHVVSDTADANETGIGWRAVHPRRAPAGSCLLRGSDQDRGKTGAGRQADLLREPDRTLAERRARDDQAPAVDDRVPSKTPDPAERMPRPVGRAGSAHELQEGKARERDEREC